MKNLQHAHEEDLRRKLTYARIALWSVVALLAVTVLGYSHEVDHTLQIREVQEDFTGLAHQCMIRERARVDRLMQTMSEAVGLDVAPRVDQ